MTVIVPMADLSYMKKTLLLAILLFVSTLVSADIYWPYPAHYKYQVGMTFGVNGVSVGLADFPGSHWGAYARIGKHTYGFKRDWDGESVKLWGEPFYYKRTGVYYGWTASYRFIQWGPQIGTGLLEYNHPTYGNEPSRPQDESIYGEIAINGLVNIRGTGLGTKIFFNLNKFSPILGATMYLQFGYAWNPIQRGGS